METTPADIRRYGRDICARCCEKGAVAKHLELVEKRQRDCARLYCRAGRDRSSEACNARNELEHGLAVDMAKQRRTLATWL